MHISEVKTAFKIADVEFVAGSTRLNFNYLQNLKDDNGNPLPQKILTENLARVYLIVVDGKIKKLAVVKTKVGLKGHCLFIGMVVLRGVLAFAVLGFGIFYIIRF